MWFFFLFLSVLQFVNRRKIWLVLLSLTSGYRLHHISVTSPPVQYTGKFRPQLSCSPSLLQVHYLWPLVTPTLTMSRRNLNLTHNSHLKCSKSLHIRRSVGVGKWRHLEKHSGRTDMRHPTRPRKPVTLFVFCLTGFKVHVFQNVFITGWLIGLKLFPRKVILITISVVFMQLRQQYVWKPNNIVYRLTRCLHSKYAKMWWTSFSVIHFCFSVRVICSEFIFILLNCVVGDDCTAFEIPWIKLIVYLGSSYCSLSAHETP